MGNNIEKTNIIGANNQIIGGDLITNQTINNNYFESYGHKTYREVFDLNQIKNSKGFIEVSQFDDALTKLETQNAIIIVGCSGIGKTSLSFIISNYFMQKQNYNFRFVTVPNDIDFDNILNIISKNNDEKEIIIIDDFLGNSTLNLSENKKRILEKFISSIDSFQNKKFIFTTRKTILKQLSNDCKTISFMLKVKLFQIDLDTYDEKDKLNIFIFYCQKNGIIDNIKNLITEKIWNDITIKKILEHTNFTPLIIEFATKLCKEKSPQNYSSVILSLLEHPKSIWEKEINALDSHSRKYMDILLSLSSSSNINCTISDECFKKYMQTKEGNIDYVVGKIHSNLEILIKSHDKYLSFSHPSLIEYLDEHITEQTREDIINSALYLEQIEKMDNTDNSCHIRDLMNIVGNKPPKIFNLKVMPLTINLGEHRNEFVNFIWTYYLKYLYELQINDANHEIISIQVLKEILKYERYILSFHSADIINTFSLDFDFSDIIKNEKNLQLLFSYANSTNIWYLLKVSIYKNKEGYDYFKIPYFVKESLLEILKDMYVEQLEVCNIEEYVNEELENYDEGETFDYDDIIDAVRNRIYDDLDFSSVNNIVEIILKKHSIYNFDDMEQIDDDNELFEKFLEYNFIEDEITEILDNL